MEPADPLLSKGVVYRLAAILQQNLVAIWSKQTLGWWLQITTLNALRGMITL
jgi:hypothetical protein